MHAVKKAQFLVQDQFNYRFLQLRLIKKVIITSIFQMTSFAFCLVFTALTESLRYF